MKIAITINLGSSLWSNGLNQNALYLAMVFKKLGHDTDLIYNDSSTGDALNQAVKVYPKIVPITSAISNRYDVIFSLGFSISNKILETLKKSNQKIKYVQYKCGNDFLVDTESLLFDAHKHRDSQNSLINLESSAKPDQVWIIPQMENTNYNYYQFQSGQDNVTVVPFVWDPILIESEAKKIGFNVFDRKTIKRIAVLEPNQSVFKHVLMPIVIISKYLNSGGCLDELHTFSTSSIKDSIIFKKALYLSRINDKLKVTANGRFPILGVLKNHADLVVSWQWENPLNYLYFDVAWFGFPIVHNAELCKDIGYYYTGFNADEASDLIKYVIDQHIHNNKYIEYNRAAINRYTSNNVDLIYNYGRLLDNLFFDNFIRYKYDWETNSII